MRSLLSYLGLYAIIFCLSISSQAQSSVFHKIAQDPDLQEFEDALRQSGLDEVFKGPGVFTIFAPTNDAWPSLPANISQENLKDIILTHCVAGHYRSLDFVDGHAVSSMNQRNLTVKRTGSQIFINGNLLKELDIRGSNGLVHVMDSWIPKNTTTETTVMSIIENSSKHFVLETIIKNADFESRFEDKSKQLTVFAPSDEAFFKLTSAKLDKFLGTNINYIENHIFYHVVNQLVEEGDFKHGQDLLAANGQELSITINIGGTYVNNVKIGFAGLRAVNGIVYTIHTVLIPEELPDFTIADFIDDSDDHTILSKHIADTGFRPLLGAPGALTYFAPTDQAWESLEQEVQDDLENDLDALHNVLQNHLLTDKWYLDDLQDEEELMSVNGFELVISDDNIFVYVNDAKFEVFNIEADNGLVHVIDEVLIEEYEDRFTVRELLMINENLSTFSNYVENSGFGEVLDGDGPFTVFAPSNLALVNLPAEIKNNLDSGDADLIIDFIENHVINELLESPLLTHELNLTSRNGFIIKVTVDANGDIFINDSEIIVRNLQADNGVVHVLDAALYSEEDPNTIYNYVNQNENLSILSNAIQRASLEFLYDGSGPLSLFAPTNAAFNALGASELDLLISGPTPVLVDLLLAHTLNDAYTIDELLALGSILNTNGDPLEIYTNGGEFFVNNAQIVVRDIELENGIVHVVDALIEPPNSTNTILDIIEDSDDHVFMLDAIEVSDMTDRYDNDSPLTLFAPTDAAINALGTAEWLSILNDPSGMLTDFLNLHTYEGELATADMTDQLMIMAANGEELIISVNNDGIFVNNAELIIRDIEADNGIVHVIDAVIEPIQPRNTVYDIIANNDEYSMLEEAVISAGLQDLLINENSITLFAPTNDAFNNLDPALLNQLMADPNGALRELLEYHLFSHNITTSSMFDGLTLVMFNSEQTFISDRMDGLYINESKIVDEDQAADNGWVHGIDNILELVVELVNVYDIISLEEDLSTYKSMIDLAGLDDDLMEADLITVFAPSNEAFDALDPAIVTSLTSDPNGELRSLLMAHHSESLLLSSFLTDGLNITMSDGSTAQVSVVQNDIYINDARIEVRDLEADNGVVHVLDAFLVELSVPYTVYDLIKDRSGHSFLVSAIDAASYDEDLKNANGITFFAPTDQAISLQSQDEWNQILNDPDGLLRDFMMDHTYDDELGFLDLKDGLELEMLSGLMTIITIGSDGFYINDAKISVFELKADNGIVYIIDAVIKEPVARKSIYDWLSSSADHIILKQVIDEAGLDDMLINDSDLSLFAPTDDAFNDLAPGKLSALLDDPMGSLRDLLMDHIYMGVLESGDLSDMFEFDLSGGLNALISVDSGNKYVNEARILEEDILADNGIIHVMESIIMERPSAVSEEQIDELLIYPNPSTDVLFIENRSNSFGVQIDNIQLVNNLGQLMLKKKVDTHSVKLNIGELDSGMYFLILDDNWNKSIRIVKH